MISRLRLRDGERAVTDYDGKASGIERKTPTHGVKKHDRGRRGFLLSGDNCDLMNFAAPAVSSPLLAPDPFAPEGVDFQPVSDQLIVARVITAAVFTLVCTVALLALALLANPWWWLGVGVSLLLLGWEIWLARRQVRALGYAERADDLLIRRGIFFRSIVVVPYGRMQYVDVTAGPLQRALGIATVRLHTAAAQTDATIPGLVPAAADALRDRLTERGQARLQGL